MALALSLLGSACWYGKAYHFAEAATASFHDSLDVGDGQRIYDGADPQFRATTNADEFLAYLSAVHRKLGRHLTTHFGSSAVEFEGRVTRVSMKCTTRFEEGEAEEDFVWLVERSSCRLASYKISSRTLVVK